MSVANTASSLSTVAYDYLLNSILDNVFLPGQIINRRAIAGELGISVAPVLEAMILLESEGLLETISRKGTQVTIMRESDIVGNLFLRGALECMAARIFCGERISAYKSKLVPLAEQADQAELRSKEYHRLDLQLHRAMVDLCEMESYSKEYYKIANLSLFHNLNRLVTSEDALDRSNHVELINALCAATPEQAQQIMYRHVTRGKGRLM